MVFCTFELQTQPSETVLSANAVIAFDKPDIECIPLGTPKCWDETLLKRIDIDQYHILHICGRLILHGFHNSVTDHRNIWGLNNISRGSFEASYLTEKGKVYFGIKHGEGKACFLSDDSAIMLLLPKGCKLSDEEIMMRFQKNHVQFFSDESQNINKCLRELVEVYKGMLAIHYDIFGERSIALFGKGSEKLFTEADFVNWTKNDPELIYRKCF